MVHAQHQVRGNRPLDRLVNSALKQLAKLGYSRRSMRRYFTIWRHLTEYSRQGGFGDSYSADLAASFLRTCRIQEGEALPPKEAWRRHAVYAVKVLGDFAQDGRIERWRTDMQRVQIPPAMKKPLRDYEQYCLDRCYLRPCTVTARIREIAIFLDFLGGRNVTRLSQLQAADLIAFVSSQQRFRATTVSRIVSDLRLFLRFLTQRGITQHDLSVALPKIRIPRYTRVPPVWDQALLEQLLKAVDRSSPMGKRDYAIFLLACRLGLRPGDIRSLTLDNLDWDTATLRIVQSKTGRPLCLPLPDEVGKALIDYLRNGRPQTGHREVFLRLRPPFAPFRQSFHLSSLLSFWRERAGIRFHTEQRHGLHSLRHTLATQLLQQDTPFPVIADILGHATTTTTLIYAKADVEGLRRAALDIEEVRHDG